MDGFDATARGVDLSLPHRVHPARQGEPPHPGLLLLHGRGADELDLMPLAAALDPRLLTVTVRAPLRFPWGGFAWYELDPKGIGFPEADTLEASIALLRAVLREVVETYPIDPARLYAGGFSMGAVMAGTLALLEPDHVAGAAILSGYLPLGAGLPFRLPEAADHPIFEAHGRYDQVIPVAFGRETRDFLAGTPVDLRYREYPMAHEISPEELTDLATWFTSALDSEGPTSTDETA